MRPLNDGGAQEFGMRAGTENVASIVGMAKALEISCSALNENAEHILKLENALLERLKESGLDFVRNGARNHIPGNISVSFKDADGEAILHRLDLMGICVSTGSACDSVSTQISHVLKAIKLKDNYARGTIRISFGKENTFEEANIIAESLIRILKNERENMDIDAKLRPLFLLQILKERTDEDNYLTTTQLCDILKREYGLDTHRTTLKSDIEVLQRAGYSIDERRSTQNQYRFTEMEFEVAELKTIIDAVASSKFIAEGKSNELIKKLTSLAGSHKARELKRNVIVDGRGKIENKQILYIIDAINDAINQRKKISFQKIEYNIKKERVLHHGGERYTFSPYSLVWDGDNYYVVGYSDKYQTIGSHRVDRIAACPYILDESAVPQPVGFDVSKYIKTTFRMYNAPRAEVELLCDNSVMDAIIDRFGPDVQTYAGDLQNFRVIEEIAVGKVFFNWIFGFEGKVRIKGPESVKKQYREMVMSAMNLV